MSSIIVALDGSSFADAALPVALGLARVMNASLELVSVIEPAPGLRAISGAPVHELELDRVLEQRLRAELGEKLEHCRARVAAMHEAPVVTTTLLNGPAAAALLEHAERRQARALVITTHGRGGISRLWLGSVTEALLRHARLPIVAVRPGETVPDIAGALVPTPLERVLVTLDGSAKSERVIAPLQAMFGARTRYLVMRAISPLHPLLQRLASAEEYARDLAAQTALVLRYLDDVVTQMRTTGIEVDSCSPTRFEAAEAINEAAREHDASLIAIATHGRGAIGRFLLGSVADKVLRGADRPVLLYRIADEDTM